jgi:hypothetical protein
MEKYGRHSKSKGDGQKKNMKGVEAWFMDAGKAGT